MTLKNVLEEKKDCEIELWGILQIETTPLKVYELQFNYKRQ